MQTVRDSAGIILGVSLRRRRRSDPKIDPADDGATVLRRCSRCGERMPETAFYQNRRGRVCRQCHATYVRDQRKSERRKDAEARLSGLLTRITPVKFECNRRPRRQFGKYILLPDRWTGEFDKDAVMRVYTIKQVSEMGFGSPASIYRWMAAGDFPKPIRLGKRSPRFTEEMLRDYARKRGGHIGSV